MRYDYEGRSFPAFDSHGREYLISPVYRKRADGDDANSKTFSAGDCVGLLTEDGRWVRRDRKGRYAIMGTSTASEVTLVSQSEGAV